MAFQTYDVKLNALTIEGTSVAEYFPATATISTTKFSDYPSFGTYSSNEINIPLISLNGMFDPGKSSNFFTDRSLDANGQGGKVYLEVARDSDVYHFAGTITALTLTLDDTIAVMTIHDLSLPLRNSRLEDFGQSITRKISDLDGYADSYSESDPVFRFPRWGVPIIPGSVSLTASPALTVVDNVKTSGTLSKTNVEIDYTAGSIRFEAPPDDEDELAITATWKIDYRYKRPDALVRLLLDNGGIFDQIEITNKKYEAFAVEQSLVRLSDESFTSNGRPYFEDEGIVRGLKRDATNDKMFMIQDRNLIEYDEQLDEYTKVSTVPDDTSITGTPPGGYGTEIVSERINVPLLSGHSQLYTALAISPTGVVYIPYRYTLNSTERIGVYRYNLAGARDTVDFTLHTGNADNPVTANSFRISGLGWGNGFLQAVSFASTRAEINPATGFVETLGFSDGATIINREGISYHNEQLWALGSTTTTQGISGFRSNKVQIYNQMGQLQSGGFDLPNDYYASGIAVNGSYVYLSIYDTAGKYFIGVFTHSGVEQTHLRFNEQNASDVTADDQIRGIFFYNERLYGVSGGTTQGVVKVYSLSGSLNYHDFIPYSFDTPDFDNFYLLCTNSLKGDNRQDTSFNRNRVYKYKRSTNTWTTILSPSKGNPQLAHPIPTPSDILEYADNRKNFQVVSRSSKLLIFVRRVQTSKAGVLMFNETDNTLTDVFSENTSTNDGRPYSMDFCLDIQTVGIDVYTLTISRSISSGQTSTQLRCYRRRMQPTGTQATLFTENATTTSTARDYPISISGVILSTQRDKIYFVLTYANADNDVQGKAELCWINQDGTGTRTVLKTYNDPLLAARSPVKVGTGANEKIYYLEGTSNRQPKSSTDPNIPASQHYYPNEGGHLIEVKSDGTIGDQGQLWRSSTKDDSPDVDSDVYDGWGLHNSITSNMIVDERDNLHFIAGYGSPYRVTNNLPGASLDNAVADGENFIWLQWGKDLSTKVPIFRTTGRPAWGLIQDLARLMDWETGFGPARRLIDTAQTADTSINDWEAQASLFFRPKTALPGKLRAAISASGTPTTIGINNQDIPGSDTEFPKPGTGETHTIIIGTEIFSYGATTVDANGVVLGSITRAQNGSTAAAHAADADIYFVDRLIRENDMSLISITSRSQDFINQFNVITARYSDGVHTETDSTSINQIGERELQIALPLRAENLDWVKDLSASYLARFKDLKDVLQMQIMWDPLIDVGQLIVLEVSDPFVFDYQKFQVVRMRHDLGQFQTSLYLRSL